MLNNNNKTILHLSDLHFSAKHNEQEQNNRDLLLNGLLDELSSLEPDWRPSLVCITGDIVDKADVTGYEQASEWLKKLADIFEINFDKFIICPGNHDGVRDVQICPPTVPKTAEEADNILTNRIPDYLQNRFSDFSKFCKELGIPPYKIGAYNSYLTGSREIDGIQFVACNTAWYSFEENDHSRLWLGLNILRYLEHNNQLVSSGSAGKQKLSIALMHHGTETYFQEPEKQSHDNRPPTLQYLWKRCHLALYGHSHENAIGDPNKMQAHCWTVRAGATNAGAKHPNSINLIRIANTGLEIRLLEYNPADTSSQWVQNRSVKKYLWEDVESSEDKKNNFQNKQFGEKQSILRERSIEYADGVIENKSRQIKPYGDLPNQIPLQVIVKPETEINDARWLQKTDIDKPMVLYLPIDEAIARSRLSLLLGDLGAGKSTILAKLALTIGDQIPKCIPLFIPARRLNVNVEDGITELLTLVSNFIKSDLMPGESCTTKDFIDAGFEIFFLIDGLDEIDKHSAICLTRLLARIPMLYSRVSIVLSSRLSDMAGVDYNKWQVCQVPLLTSKQKEDLLRNEAIAQGKKYKDATEDTRNALVSLEANPLLHSIANSPLAVRLLFKSLTKDSTIDQERTLGDLLYDLLLQRLGEWAEIDLKTSTTREFESLFPTPETKALLLGQLAFRSYHGNLSRVEITEIIKEYISKDWNKQASLITKQALTFFETNGIIATLEPIEFVYQPLGQIAAGVYLSEILNEKEQSPTLEPNFWRIVSFTGTLIRRKNRVDEKREWFNNFLKSLMKTREGIAPACYICNELHDKVIAQRIVDRLPNLGRRPLWYLEEERGASVLAIAHTLIFAGDKGFDWLYSEYLDPKTPPTNTGSALIRDLFNKWSLLIKPRLTASQKSRLSDIIKPLLETQPTGTIGFLENLAYLVPDIFDLEQFLWVSASLLNTNDFSEWAIEQFKKYYHEGNEQLVNAILVRKPNKVGSMIWLELNSKEKPPVSIVKTLLSASANDDFRPDKNNTYKALVDCYNRIGNTRWVPLLRWLLTDPDNKVAAAAALKLREKGEDSLYLLGNALAKGLNNRKIDSKGEAALRELVAVSKNTEIKWPNLLFNNIDLSIGASPGIWRIFLDTLKDGVDNGPKLLINNIANIGSYNISRYPGIRLAFKDLLSESNGQSYRKAFKTALNHYDPNVRHAAAMVLTACFSDEEGLALVTVVSFIDFDHDYREWEKFLITLNFGPSVLETLKNALPTFSGESRIVALAVLVHNGITLQDVEKRDLVLGATNWRIDYIDSIDLGEYNLSSEFAYNLLLHELNNRLFADCSQIAKVLLKHHGQNLITYDKVKCYVATTSDNIDSIRYLLSLLNEKELADSLKHLCESIPPKEFPKLLRDFFDDNDNLSVNWNEVLWNIFCSDKMRKSLFSEDDIGLDLLWLGQEQPEIGQALGQAAKSLLNDERVQKHRWTNHYHWLGVIADEFIGLKKEKLKEIVCVGNVLYGSATCSILRRMGEVPSDFSSRDKHNSFPKDSLNSNKPVLSEQIHEELIDAARESELLKSGITRLITQTLVNIQISQNFLDGLALKGKNGCLLAGVLAYCYDLDIKADYAFSFNDYYVTVEQENSADYKRLKKVSYLSHAALIRLNSEAKTEYVEALLNALDKTDYHKGYYIFEVLRVQKQITLEQAYYLLPLFASPDGFSGMDRNIVSILSEWGRNLTKSVIKDELLKISVKCLENLDRYPWGGNRISRRDPSVYLYFPLTFWSVGGKPDNLSCRVFARGIKHMFDTKDYRHNQRRFEQNVIIQSVGPLIKCVPLHILREALSQLTDFPIAEVRTWVTFFHCFTQNE